MKILICCAGGFSSSIIETNLALYGQQIHEEIICRAVGVGEVDELIREGFQILLYAPQVKNRARYLEASAKEAGIPCTLMKLQDYAMANAEKIYKQAKKIIDESIEKREIKI